MVKKWLIKYVAECKPYQEIVYARNEADAIEVFIESSLRPKLERKRNPLFLNGQFEVSVHLLNQ